MTAGVRGPAPRTFLLFEVLARFALQVNSTLAFWASILLSFSEVSENKEDFAYVSSCSFPDRTRGVQLTLPQVVTGDSFPAPGMMSGGVMATYDCCARPFFLW